MKKQLSGIPFYFLLLLLAGILPGCSNSREPLPDQPVFITPALPQAGETVTIYYNQRHKNAHYKNDTLLFATLRTTSNTEGWRDFRFAMKRSSKDTALWEVAFVVPGDITGFQATIAPTATIASNESYATPIYTGKNPVRGAIPIQMYTATSLKEAVGLFQNDAALYPDSYDRWHPLWAGKIQSGFDTAPIYAEVDSVRRAISKAKLRDGDKMVGLSACAYAYALLENWSEAREIVRQTQPLSKALLPFAAAAAFEGMINKLYPLERKASSMSADEKLLLQEIVTVITATQDRFLMGAMLTHADSSSIVGDSLYRSFLSVAAQSLSRERSATIRHAVLLPTLLDGLLWQERYAEAADMGTRALGFLKDVDEWPAFGMQQPVDVLPYEHIRVTIEFRVARAALALGDTTGAEQRLKSLVLGQHSGALVNGARYRASAKLADLYVTMNAMDSAEKYCAYAAGDRVMENRFHLAQKTADAINSIRKRTSAHTVTLPELITKYGMRSYGIPEYAGQQMQTSNGELTIDTNRTLYLFFVDKKCGICKKIIPGMLTEMVQRGVRTQDIVLLSEDSAERVRKDYGDRWAVAPLTAELRKTFAVAAFPTLVAVGKGRGAFRSDGLSKGTMRELAMAVGLGTVAQ